MILHQRCFYTWGKTIFAEDGSCPVWLHQVILFYHSLHTAAGGTFRVRVAFVFKCLSFSAGETPLLTRSIELGTKDSSPDISLPINIVQLPLARPIIYPALSLLPANMPGNNRTRPRRVWDPIPEPSAGTFSLKEPQVLWVSRAQHPYAGSSFRPLVSAISFVQPQSKAHR